MIYDIINDMAKRLRKDGTPDKRFKPNKPKNKVKDVISTEATVVEKEDPQELFNRILEENNLQIDFDVLEGSVSTKHGVIKLEKPTLVVKASYVQS